jgi:localization factor PodJL
MSVGAPWSVKGIDPKAREVAKDLARRSGMTLGEWLNRVILEDDIPEDVTAESQFGERSFRSGREPPRLMAVPSGPPEFARVAAALDRLTDRIEASETRTGLAINGVEHSVRQALARIEAAEREQHASATRLEGLLAEASAQQSYFGERLRRLEAEPAGPRSAEALRILESRLAEAEPEALVETVLQRLGGRLADAEGRTAGALENLGHALAALDRRLSAVEREGGGDAEAKFEALGQVLAHRVEAVRAEVAEKIAEAGGGPAVEARFSELAQQVRAAERRSAQAVEDIGRQVLAMAEAVNRKLGDIDQRNADAIDQVGSEVARIAGAVELRLARGEQAQAEAFERFGADLSRLAETITGVRGAEPSEAPAAAAPSPAALVDETAAQDEAAALAAALGALGPPPEPEPEPSADAAVAAAEMAAKVLGPPPEPEPEAQSFSAAFGPELFSRAEPERPPAKEEVEPGPERIEAPWRRLDLEVPETTIPEAFAPLAEDDEDLFREPPTGEPGPELSTREVIERARAAARAAQDRGDEAPPRPEVRAGLKTAASGRLFEGFGVRARRAPRHTALQTALMVAGGAAFMSVGAAGLVLMREPAQQAASLAPEGAAPRAAMARSPAALPPESLPAFDTVRADVEAGVPGAIGILRSLAESGHAQALLYLAQLYDEGDAGLPQDPAEARRLTTLAAEAGDVKAAHNLGVYLFRGEGGPQDLSKAAHWFGRAAAAGVVESQYNLGLLYQSGSGVEKDLAEARHWFAQAAAKGDPEARQALAAMSPEPKPRVKPTAAIQPPVGGASRAALVGTSMNVRQTQLTLTRLGYYDGPLDGRASTAYHRAVAAWRRGQAGDPLLHISRS